MTRPKNPAQPKARAPKRVYVPIDERTGDVTPTWAEVTIKAAKGDAYMEVERVAVYELKEIRDV